MSVKAKFEWWLISILLLVSFNAQASMLWEPFIGASYKIWDFDFNTIDGISGNRVFDNSLDSIQFNLGAKVNKYLGFQVGYGISADEHKHNILGTGQNSRINIQNWDLDAILFFPFTPKERLELLALVGAEYLHPTLRANYSAIGFTNYDGAQNEVRLRMGLGFNLHLSQSFYLRFLATSSDPSFDGLVRTTNTYQLGMFYKILD